MDLVPIVPPPPTRLLLPLQTVQHVPLQGRHVQAQAIPAIRRTSAVFRRVHLAHRVTIA